MDMEFQTNLPIDQAVRSLQAAIDEPPLAIVDLRSRLHLAGQVRPERVVLHRDRRRSTSYGHFEGRFTADGHATRLVGSFVREPAGILSSPAGMPIAIALVCAFLAVIRWKSRQDLAQVFMALVFGGTGALFIWLRASKARNEAILLRAEIAKKLGCPGA